MRIALFRAPDDAARTAERLRTMGHEPVLAPVIDIVPTGATIPAGAFAAVIFASAHAIDTLGAGELRAIRDLPAFCVVARTAARALAERLLPVGTAADAARLVRLIRSELPHPARLLLVAGRERKPTIEAGLGAAGHAVEVVERYEARAVTAWPDAIIADWMQTAVDAALHYSRRSADLAWQCATRGGLRDQFRAAVHHCLSADVAAALEAAEVHLTVVADKPNEASLLEGLTRR